MDAWTVLFAKVVRVRSSTWAAAKIIRIQIGFQREDGGKLQLLPSLRFSSNLSPRIILPGAVLVLHPGVTIERVTRFLTPFYTPSGPMRAVSMHSKFQGNACVPPETSGWSLGKCFTALSSRNKDRLS